MPEEIFGKPNSLVKHIKKNLHSDRPFAKTPISSRGLKSKAILMHNERLPASSSISFSAKKSQGKKNSSQKKKVVIINPNHIVKNANSVIGDRTRQVSMRC